MSRFLRSQRPAFVSALALSLALTGPASAQMITFETMPEDLRNRLEKLATRCQEEGTLPKKYRDIGCDTIIAWQQEQAARAEAGPADDDNAAALAEALAAEEAEAAAAAEAEAEAAAAAEAEAEAAAAAEAEAAAQAEVEAAAAEAAEAEAQARADAEAAEAEAAAEAQAAADAEAAEAEAAIKAEAEAAERAAAEAATENAPKKDDGVLSLITRPAEGADDKDEAAAVDPEVPVEPTPEDSQAQADALVEEESGAAAAAAAVDVDGGGADGAVVVEETVAEDDVRQSSEDFDTRADAVVDPGKDKPKRAKEDDDNGDENARRARNAALLGLGAVALSEILGGNDNVVSNSGDRVVIENQGRLRVLRNDDVLLRRPGADVQTYRFDDGSTRTVVSYADGSVVETIRTAQGRTLRRTRILPDGTEVVLFDDTQATEQVVVNELPQVDDRRRTNFREVEGADLADALAAQQAAPIDRTFSLNQIRNIDAVRQLVPEITVDTINFQTASAAIRPDEAEELAALGNAIRRLIEQNPYEVFLIEGHTDAVGNAAYNLALSDRRAESVALALTEYFQVPPENMILQGYGESDLLIPTLEDERLNRRAAVRRITPLLRSASN